MGKGRREGLGMLPRGREEEGVESGEEGEEGGASRRSAQSAVPILKMHHRPGCKELSDPGLDFSILPPLTFVNIYF